MKRLSVLSVALSLIVILSGSALATLGGNTNDTIGVSATVGPYAEIRLADEHLHIDWWQGDFAGAAEESRTKSTTFQISSNTPVTLSADFGPLTHDDDSAYSIHTTLGIWYMAWDTAGESWYDNWAMTLQGVRAPGSSVQTSSSWNNPVQGVGLQQYRLRVGAVLGDVHEQAAGDYSTEVILTIAAAN